MMVITRVAPSPTGAFHLGTARTALYNYLFARQNKGLFYLRIEDTDKLRSDRKWVKDITDSMRWLGLNWDKKIVFQSDRLRIYQKEAGKLLDKNLTYRQDGAIWLKVKLLIDSAKLEFNDIIRGKMAIPQDAIDDFVIIKSDQSPLFLFTNAIDDHLMNITHVIRGEDHITNTFRQILIAKALDYQLPQYAHIPLILAPDRSKLSKRSGAISLSELRTQGYLSQTLINFLALLGWHEKENISYSAENKYIYSLNDLIKKFELNRVQKSGAIFDQQMLDSINHYYIHQLNNKQLGIELRSQLDKVAKKHPDCNLNNTIAIAKERIKKLADFTTAADEILSLTNYQKSLLIFPKSTENKTKQGLSSTLNILKTAQFNSALNLSNNLETAVKENKLSNGDVFWPVRVALSGKKASPGPEQLMSALGKKVSIKRLQTALNKLK